MLGAVGPCPSLLSLAVRNTTIKGRKQTVCLAYTHSSHLTFESRRVGTEAGAAGTMEKGCLQACSPQLSRGGITHSRSGSPTSTVNQENAPKVWPQATPPRWLTNTTSTIDHLLTRHTNTPLLNHTFLLLLPRVHVISQYKVSYKFKTLQPLKFRNPRSHSSPLQPPSPKENKNTQNKVNKTKHRKHSAMEAEVCHLGHMM